MDSNFWNYRRPRPWTPTRTRTHDTSIGKSNASTTMPWNVLTDYQLVCVYIINSLGEPKLKLVARNCISPFVSTTTKQFNKNANGSVPFKIIVDAKYMCKLIPS